MKLFIDANILVAVLNKEYPLFTHAARVLSLSGDKRFTLFTSPICFAIAFYFAEKKSGSTLAKKKIALLADKIDIAENLKADILKTTQNKKINDFEDGLEYYAALNSGCTCIVTQDKDDFYFSDLQVLTAEAFLQQHVMPKK